MMSLRILVLRSLAHYWRTNAAVVAGVATAVAVLSGALVVGDSVRGTLKDLALHRLGAAAIVVTSPRFFREAMADDLRGSSQFRTLFADAVTLVAMPGVVTAQGTGRRAGKVLVYGINERFWQFHHASGMNGPRDREVLVSRALAAETGLVVGDAALVRIEQPSAVPLESLHGRRDSIGRTLRLTVSRVLEPEMFGEFAIAPQQGEVLAVFVPLQRLQEELEVDGRANTLLVSIPGDRTPRPPLGVLEVLIRDHAKLDDVGLTLRALGKRHALSVESDSGLLGTADAAAVGEAVESTLLVTHPVFTYLANTIQVGSRSVPYSLVTAMDLRALGARIAPAGGNVAPIVLNEWAARELSARVGDTVRLDYYVWEEPGRLTTREAEFHLAGVVPVRPEDQDFAPRFKGITDSPTLESWDPPFPLDLKRVRPADEAYWRAYRTTPKAYIPLEVGQRLWGSRYGAVTSIRVDALADRDLAETAQAFDERLRSKVDPFAFGMSATDVGRTSLDAAAGTTNFGEYFLYFSAFIVVAALVLAALFFKLGVEQRSREVGLLYAVGVEARSVQLAFTVEAAAIALVGAAIGVLAAVAYAWLVVTGLSTWWVDAVGTRALTVHVSLRSLVIGAMGGLAAAIFCTMWTLRGMSRISPRALLGGELDGSAFVGRDFSPAFKRKARASARYLWVATGLVIGAMSLVLSATTGTTDRAAAFFGAGGMLLTAVLCLYAFLYRLPPRRTVQGRGWAPIVRLGLRSASFRPGRSVLSIGVIASATFILIAVDAFRRDRVLDTDRQSGVGGYSLLVESPLPIVHDPGGESGRRELNLASLENTRVETFRLRPGDDASCLNLYAPQTPRIIGARPAFIAEGRFAFQRSLATTEADRANPWRLLETRLPDDAVPVIGDANSMTYVLHRAVGEDFVMKIGDRSIRLRFVAALRDSIFQSELVMSEANFRAVFPEREGYQMWLVEAPPDREAALGRDIENALTDYGADVISTSARLAGYHRVENAYLSTFQTLGGLGLAIGTIGLAAVLLRNVFERRRELALLGAVGYRRRHFVVMLVAESLSWLVGGLLAGAVSAGVAILPALLDRGGRLPVSASGLMLVFAVLVAGLVSTVIAARLATRAPLLAALRSE